MVWPTEFNLRGALVIIDESERLFAQLDGVMKIDDLQTLAGDVVEAAGTTLVIEPG